MGKSRNDRRGFTREQKLLHENQRLKKQLAQLRKQLARVDLDRYENIKEIIQKHYQDERAQEGQDILDRLKEEWKCRECQNGYLEIFTYNKMGNTWYYRVCSNSSNCKHRTKPQPYSPANVKGILKKV